MTEHVAPQQTVDPLTVGYLALEQGDWNASLTHFREAGETGAPEALESVAMAA